jgi:RecB family exonuclease
MDVMTAAAELELEGLPRRLFSCTPSRLTTWVDCPRHYRMRYLDRPRPAQGPPWAHNSLGASVHNALAGWWRLAAKARTAETAGQLLDAGWLSDGFRDEQQSARWRDRARDMVRRYVATLDPHREPLGVERTLAARTNRLALSGRLDRLDDRAGRLVVVDYKTGRRPPTVDDARGSAALALYAVAASSTLRRPCHDVELHHVPTGEVVSWRHTEESLARQVRPAQDVAHQIQAAGTQPAQAFPARPGGQCGWCTFRAHCPEGQRAAPAREPWAALDDLEPAED